MLRGALVPQAIFFSLPVLSWLYFWAGEYRVDEAVKSRALPYRLAQGLPMHESPTLGQYLLMKARHNFYFFVPLGLATLAETIADRFKTRYEWLPTVASLAITGTMLMCLPWMLTRIWSTVGMTGELRGKLEHLAAKHRIRFSNILIWRTHFAINNAAILGYLPWSRYFLMTDSLLESLTDRQIEAVFAHEVGHAVHKHIWWYMVAIGGGLMAAVGLSEFAGLGLSHLWRGINGHEDDVVGGLQLALMGAFMAWGFAPISRRFEHQADWFATRHIASEVTAGAGMEARSHEAPPHTKEHEAIIEPQADASRHGEGDSAEGQGGSRMEVQVDASVPPGIGQAELKRSMGAEVFSGALFHLVQLANRPLNRGGWMHPSPLRRRELLLELALDPALAKAFEKRMWWTRAWIATLFVAGAALTAGAMAVGN